MRFITLAIVLAASAGCAKQTPQAAVPTDAVTTTAADAVTPEAEAAAEQVPPCPEEADPLLVERPDVALKSIQEEREGPGCPELPPGAGEPSTVGGQPPR